jgi:hypothetical protein
MKSLSESISNGALRRDVRDVRDARSPLAGRPDPGAVDDFPRVGVAGTAAVPVRRSGLAPLEAGPPVRGPGCHERRPGALE